MLVQLNEALCCAVIVTCLMLLVTNQTMKIREHTWTPVTITDVLTIPATEPEEEKNKFAAAEVLACVHTLFTF